MQPLPSIATVFLLFSNLSTLARTQTIGASSDSPQDSDIYQSSYLGGDHNIDPSDLPHFTQLWNATFNSDEKVRLVAVYLSRCLSDHE